MGFYVNTTDFIGKFQISQGIYNTTDLNSYIQKYELKYLVELLGVDLYNAYYLDANAQPNKIPTNPLYLFIYNPFIYQNQLQYNDVLYSYGIKEMLIGFIYFEFTKDQISFNTVGGTVKQIAENSDCVTTTLYGRYNDSVLTYQAIQNYILNVSGSYPSFKGITKQYAYWL